MLKASVLIVEDDPRLLLEQAALLSDCEVMTTGSRDAKEAIRAVAFHLLIIGETVPDAKMLGRVNTIAEPRR
jgi:DNA-binding NtrC family response regulator